VEVVADVHLDRTDASVEVLPDKGVRRGLRELERERLDDDSIDTGELEKLDLLLGRREQAGGAIRLQHLPRVRVEGIDHGLPAQSLRPANHGLHDRLMTQMKSVEVANRQDRTPEGGVDRPAPRDVPQC
jgi:hypothetical protein